MAARSEPRISRQVTEAGASWSGVLFDLDGTLLDTLADLARAANQALIASGFAPHAIEAYRDFVGEGVHVLFSRALPTEQRGERQIARCVQDFRELYEREWDVSSRPYPGICDLLESLASRGLRLTVLSNKPHAFTTRCVDKLLPNRRFDVVLGQRDGVPRKPDPAGAFEIAKLLGLRPAQILYLGDSGVDMQTADRAGMFAVGALWGFRSRGELLACGAKVLIAEPLDLLGVIDGGPMSLSAKPRDRQLK